MNPSYIYREAVKSRRLQNTSSEPVVVGYVLDNNGYHDGKRLIKNTPECVSNFITQNVQDKLLCTLDDYLILNTMGRYVDVCSDEEYLASLLPTLIKKQKYRGL